MELLIGVNSLHLHRTMAGQQQVDEHSIREHSHAGLSNFKTVGKSHTVRVYHCQGTGYIYSIAFNTQIFTSSEEIACNGYMKLGSTSSPKLSVHGSTALVELGRFFSFLIYSQSVRLLDGG
jgi:hypothetical protein